TEPLHDVARLDGHFGNAFLQHFGQIPGAFFRVLAGLHRLLLEELLVNRAPRDAIWGRHRGMFDRGPIDYFLRLRPVPYAARYRACAARGLALRAKQFPGCIPVVSGSIFSVKHDVDDDVIRDFLVHVLGLVSWDKIGCASADRVQAHGAQMLVSVAGAVHAHRQMREKTRTLLPIALPLQTSRQEHPGFIGFMPKPVETPRSASLTGRSLK